MGFYYILIFALVLDCACASCTRDAFLPLFHPKCEPITIAMCEDSPWTTMMPNHFNHSDQTEAGLEIHQFWPLVKSKCSRDLRFFLCSLYAPLCTARGESLPPCRSVCESSRMGCEGLMKQYGFPWPERMDCSLFPVDDGYATCFGERETDVVVTQSPRQLTSEINAPKPEDECEEITIDFCKGMSYSVTMMPNLLDHTSQEDAERELHQSWPLDVVRNSSDNLKKFLCNTYAPKCLSRRIIPNTIIPVCGYFCEIARMEGERILKDFNLTWPKELDCSKFWQFDSQKFCMNITDSSYSVEKVTTAPPPTTELPPTPPTTLSPAEVKVLTRKKHLEKLTDHDLLVFNAMNMQQLLEDNKKLSQDNGKLRQDNAKLREEMTIIEEKVDALFSGRSCRKNRYGASYRDRIRERTTPSPV